MTNHSHFNLTSNGEEDILQHQLLLHARRFTPVNATLIPTGAIENVSGTPFDFTKLTSIGSRIGADDPQLRFGQGYDHNWVLDSGTTGEIKLAAQLYEPKSGRAMEIHTTEPGIQFYSGNFLGPRIRGKANQVYSVRSGLCLEPQHFPDSPNQWSFPSTILKVGHEFKSSTIYKFSVEP